MLGYRSKHRSRAERSDPPLSPARALWGAPGRAASGPPCSPRLGARGGFVTLVLVGVASLAVFAALGAPASRVGLSRGAVCARGGGGGQGARPAAGPQVQRPRRCLVTVGGGLPGEEEGGGEHPEEKLRLDLGLVESAGERAPQVSARSAPHPAGRGPPPPSLPQPSPAGSSCCGARGARPRSACATPAS